MGNGKADEPTSDRASPRDTRVEHLDDVDDDALADVLTWLVSELGGGVLVSDDDGYVVLADARAAALFGRSRDRLEGVPIAELLAEPVVAASGAIAGSEGTRRVHARHADGSLRAMRVGVKAVTTRRGRFHVLTIRDGRTDRAPAADLDAGPTLRVLVVGPLDIGTGSALASLDASGFETLVAEVASDARIVGELELPDVVVVDGDHLSPDAPDALRTVRAGVAVPVIVVSGRADEEARLDALRSGADDYVTKPFSAAELAERVRAVGRRSAPRPPAESLVFGELVIDPNARRVMVGDRDAQLSPIEFDLLVFLARSPRHVFSREELLRHVWGSRADWQTEATVTEHVRRLRRKIEPSANSPRRIITVQRAGYRFDP